MTTLAFTISQRSCYSRWGGHLSDHGPYSVSVSIAEARGALDSDWRVLVVDASSPLLDLTADAHRACRGVIAVIDPDDPSEKDKALRADVDDMVEMGASAHEFVRVVTVVLRDLPVARPVRARPRVRPPEMDTPSKRTGAQRIVVGGPPGSDPETVALGLAAAYSKRGEVVLVVDANDTCPSVAQRLSLSLLPNLASAVDSFRSELPLDEKWLHETGGFWVLGGCEPSKWTDLGAEPVVQVTSIYAAGCARVVSVVGPVLDDLSRWGADRYAVSRALLADADVIVTVATGTPQGLAHLEQFFAEVRLIAPETPLYVIISDAPRDRYRRSQVVSLAWSLSAGAKAPIRPPDGVILLPPENRKARRATWDGTLRTKGKTAKALAGLAATVALKGDKW